MLAPEIARQLCHIIKVFYKIFLADADSTFPVISIRKQYSVDFLIVRTGFNLRLVGLGMLIERRYILMVSGLLNTEHLDRNTRQDVIVKVRLCGIFLLRRGLFGVFVLIRIGVTRNSSSVGQVSITINVRRSEGLGDIEGNRGCIRRMEPVKVSSVCVIATLSIATSVASLSVTVKLAPGLPSTVMAYSRVTVSSSGMMTLLPLTGSG